VVVCVRDQATDLLRDIWGGASTTCEWCPHYAHLLDTQSVRVEVGRGYRRGVQIGGRTVRALTREDQEGDSVDT